MESTPHLYSITYSSYSHNYIFIVRKLCCNPNCFFKVNNYFLNFQWYLSWFLRILVLFLLSKVVIEMRTIWQVFSSSFRHKNKRSSIVIEFLFVMYLQIENN